MLSRLSNGAETQRGLVILWALCKLARNGLMRPEVVLRHGPTTHGPALRYRKYVIRGDVFDSYTGVVRNGQVKWSTKTETVGSPCPLITSFLRKNPSAHIAHIRIDDGVYFNPSQEAIAANAIQRARGTWKRHSDGIMQRFMQRTYRPGGPIMMRDMQAMLAEQAAVLSAAKPRKRKRTPRRAPV